MERVTKSYSTDEVLDGMEPVVSTWFRERFSSFTEPQSMAIPVIRQRKSVLISSPTGSGKTLTAFTSILNQLIRYSNEGTLEERIYCVYISPLKALANDVNRNLNQPLAEMKEVARREGMAVPDIRVAVRSGDTPQAERQKMVRHPPHILITTPESMALILASPKFKEALLNIEWVILDEIHDICDSKRGAFLSLTMEMLQNYVGHEFTRIGLSATMAPIEEIAKYLTGFNRDGTPRDVVLIESSSKKVLDLKVICPTDDMTALPTDVVSSMMYDRLKELVDAHETTLVFTNTRSGAEAVVYKLKERGLENVAVHHSSLGREVRLDVEERLKAGEIKCVVSSTSLELGIDIGSVDLVCQIGSPKSVAKGLQRIGRSGHSFGKIAKGRLIVFDPDDLSECAVMCRAAHRSDIDRVGIPENPLDVLSQAIVGMSLDQRWDVDEAYALVKSSYCFRNLTYDRFLSVLGYLGSKEEHEGVYSKIWFDEEAMQFGKKKGAKMIYFMNLGTIPEESNYKVITSYGAVAGELSEKFVERLSPGDVFVLGGRSLEFQRSKGMTAFVKEANGRKPTVPSWAGEMLPRSFDLSMDVARFRKEMSELVDSDRKDKIPFLCKEFDIDEGSARSLISYFSEQEAVAGFIPDADRLAVEEYIDPSGNQRIIFHFPFGRRVNDALSRAYAYRITALTGANASVTITDDNFMIGTTHNIDIDMVPDMLHTTDLEPILRKAVKDSEIFKLRFRHTAARSFMILRNYRGRAISVNRQQTRSTYLLQMLRDMDNEPVIEETYREILEDDMDIRNAEVVLRMIETGEMGIRTIHFSGTPSPFAHTIILTGFTDIVLMEDRTALLKELHRKVLERALGDAVRDFEFDPDAVTQFYSQKNGRVSRKEDIPRLLMATGPLQAFRERGRNIYPFCDPDRKEVDEWIRELIREGVLCTVFLDEPHIMVSSEWKDYALATKRDRTLNEADEKVYSLVGEDTLVSDINSAADLTDDIVFRSLRKLESMYLVTRTGITENNRWYFSRCTPPEGSRSAAMDAVMLRHIGSVGPVTYQEAAFALSVPDEDAQRSLESLVASGDLAKGRFVVADNDQYMLVADRLKLRSGKSNVYDVETVENLRLRKGEEFSSIEEFFRFYTTAVSELDVYYRVKGFNLSRWQRMCAEGDIVLGRFARGRVRFMLKDDAAKYAYHRVDGTSPSDKRYLDMIRDSPDGLSMRDIVAMTGDPKEQVREAIMRLDKSMLLKRSFGERGEWGTENIYVAYEPDLSIPDPSDEVVERAIRAYGPIPVMAMRYLVNVPDDAIEPIARRIGAVQVLVGSGQMPMWIMEDELGDLNSSEKPEEIVRIRSLFDPDLGSKWAEIAARYGDRYIYPVTRGSRIIGGVELWEMSGCIEIRALDLDMPQFLEDALGAVDVMMGFFRQKGTDIVRIREVMGVDAAELDPSVAGTMGSFGYVFVNGFFAKGSFEPWCIKKEEALRLTLSRQHLDKSSRYETLNDYIVHRPYIRSDQELACRIRLPTALKRYRNKGTLVKGVLLPQYVGYATLSNMAIIRAAKQCDLSPLEEEVLKVVSDRAPISKKEIQFRVRGSYDDTADAITSLMKKTVICQDEDNYYRPVPVNGMTRDDGLIEVARWHFTDYGIMSADDVAEYLDLHMWETRHVLSLMEAEGILSKGFFIEGDSTLYWALREDVGKPVPKFNSMFILNSQDNLAHFLRKEIKESASTMRSAVFLGTKVAGTFKGKVVPGEAKVEEFSGSDEAWDFLAETARSYGISLAPRRRDDLDEMDWESSEFYSRTNPGV
ncbi:MAG: ATP-dependent helicase [Thermoplasmata archaeon]|nr:ATP-dependent helicase [Thermoplasmata archaeon]